MTLAPSASPTAPAIAGLDPQSQTIRHRLDTATMALLQTRDQVVRALDKHLAELHGLRRALAEADQVSVINAQAAATSTPVESIISSPPPASRLLSANPPAESAAPAPAPAPMGTVTQAIWAAQQSSQNQPSALPDLKSIFNMPQAPAPAVTQSQPPSTVLDALQGLQDILLQKTPPTPPPMPMNQVFPSVLPDMAHVLEAQMPAPQPVEAPQPPPAPLAPIYSQPQAAPQAQGRSPFEVAMLGSQEPISHLPQQTMQMPPPMTMREQPEMPQLHVLPPPVMTPPAPAPAAQPAPVMAREVSGIDPKLEQATLEDLNAALAFAFAQASAPSQPMAFHSKTGGLPGVAQAQHRTSPMSQQWQLPPRH